MQHHPGSWYIPWGVPLQKMLAVPFNPAPGGYQPQIAAAAVQQAQAQQQPPNQSQQSPYSHHQLQAMHHNHAAAAIHQQLNQQLHPAAAAAMFTPLTLRSFVTHPHLNLGQQPMPSAQQPQQPITSQTQSQLTTLNLNNVGVVPVRQTNTPTNNTGLILPMRKVDFLIFNSLLSLPLALNCSKSSLLSMLYQQMMRWASEHRRRVFKFQLKFNFSSNNIILANRSEIASNKIASPRERRKK